MQRPVPLWSLILAGVVCAFAGIGVAALLRPHAPKDAGPGNASAELAAAKSHLDAGEMQNAYDALLAAMRVAPGDEKVFDTSLDFVRKAGKDANDEAIPLAQDIHQRAANLIPFLPLARLKDARAAHTQAGDELFAGKKASNPEDPLAEAESLLTAARRDNLPNFARARLLHEVEAELGGQARAREEVGAGHFPFPQSGRHSLGTAQQWARLWGTRWFKSFSEPFGLALAEHWLVDSWATK